MNFYDEVRLWIASAEKLATKNYEEHPHEVLLDYFKSESKKVLWLTEEDIVNITQANTIYAVLNLLNEQKQQDLRMILEWNPESAFLRFMWQISQNKAIYLEKALESDKNFWLPPNLESLVDLFTTLWENDRIILLTKFFYTLTEEDRAKFITLVEAEESEKEIR